MVNSEMIAGKWNEIRGKVKSQWGKLTDNDLQIVGGNVDQVVGRIQQRTGEAKESIERFLEDAAANGQHAFQKVSDTVQSVAGNVAGAVSDTVKQGYEKTAETMRDGYDAAAETLSAGQEKVEEFVHARPGQSLLMAFGVGVASGVGLAMLLTSRSHAQSCTTRSYLDSFRRQMADSLSGVLPDSVVHRMRA